MYVYVLKRVLLMIPTLFGAAVLVFCLMRLIPGDVCVIRLATGSGMDPQVLANCRAEIGTDQPMWVQFLAFIKGLITLDFGKSMWTGRPIIEEIGLRFQLSLQVAIMAVLRNEAVGGENADAFGGQLFHGACDPGCPAAVGVCL